jgi:hypothetical protein
MWTEFKRITLESLKGFFFIGFSAPWLMLLAFTLGFLGKLLYNLLMAGWHVL